MELDLNGGRPPARIHVQHDLHQVLGLGRDGQPVSGVEPELAFADPLQDLVGRVLRSGGERGRSGEHHVKLERKSKSKVGWFVEGISYRKGQV